MTFRTANMETLKVRTLPFSVAVTFSLLQTWPCIDVWSAHPKADESQVQDSRVNESLAKILGVEADGIATDRRAQVPMDPRSSAIDHWHVGELLIDGEWRGFEEISSLQRRGHLSSTRPNAVHMH